MSSELVERREERSLPNYPLAVIPNTERDLIVMAVKGKGGGAFRFFPEFAI
jgi:hypothetical protein